MSEKNTDYQPPKVEVVGGEKKPQVKVEVKQPQQPLAEVKQAKSEETAPKPVQQPPVQVGKEDSPLFAIQKAKVNKYFDYLASRLSLKGQEAMGRAQAEFIDLVSESLKLEHDSFKEFTLFLIEKIKQDIEVFNKGTQFRFISYLGSKYPAENLEAHQTYVTFLYLVAKNWAIRHRLKEQVDHTYVIAKLDRKGKQNVTLLFNELTKG